MEQPYTLGKGFDGDNKAIYYEEEKLFDPLTKLSFSELKNWVAQLNCAYTQGADDGYDVGRSDGFDSGYDKGYTHGCDTIKG